jgi:hypothetical protein
MEEVGREEKDGKHAPGKRNEGLSQLAKPQWLEQGGRQKQTRNEPR